MAREAGIDGALVRRAAAELVPRSREDVQRVHSRFRGGPKGVRIEAVVAGERPAASRDQLAAVIRGNSGVWKTFRYLAVRSLGAPKRDLSVRPGVPRAGGPSR